MRCSGAGEGRVHKCLWENKDKISKQCRSQEIKIQIMQSSNTELMPNLAKACKAEREAHCKGVRAGKSRVYNCLISNSDSVRPGHSPPRPASQAEEHQQHCLLPQAADSSVMLGSRCAFCRGAPICAVQVDFTDACKDQLTKQQAKRVRDYRMDYDLRVGCKGDVPKASFHTIPLY